MTAAGRTLAARRTTTGTGDDTHPLTPRRRDPVRHIQGGDIPGNGMSIAIRGPWERGPL
jgi:hypothetical protein